MCYIKIPRLEPENVRQYIFMQICPSLTIRNIYLAKINSSQILFLLNLES